MDINILEYLAYIALPAIFSLLLVPKVTNFMLEKGVYGNDMNKLEKPKVAEMGGVALIITFTLTALIYFLNILILLELCNYQVKKKLGED